MPNEWRQEKGQIKRLVSRVSGGTAAVAESFGWQSASLGPVLASDPWVPHLKDESVGMWLINWGKDPGRRLSTLLVPEIHDLKRQ